MTTAEVKQYLTVTTPFSTKEIDKGLSIIIKDSLRALNKYKPKIFRDDLSILKNPDHIKKNVKPMRSYYDKYYQGFSESMSVVDLANDGANEGMYIYFAEQWDLEDLGVSAELKISQENGEEAEYYFFELIKAYTYLYMSNPRRAALMSDLPFDIRGDAFSGEGKEMLEKIMAELQNSVDNLL